MATVHKRFIIYFTDGKSATMIDGDGSTLVAAIEYAHGQFGSHRVLRVEAK